MRWPVILSPGLVLVCVSAVMAAADLNKGVELYRAKNYRAAAGELRPLVNSEPENGKARYYLALSLLELQDYKEATRQLGMLEKDSDSVEPSPDMVRVALARAQMGVDDLEAAKSSLDKALEANPKNPEVHLRLSEWYLHRKDYANAAKEADRTIEDAPETAYAYYYGGIAYSNLRRQDKMVDYFRKFLKLAPDAREASKVQSLLRSVR